LHARVAAEHALLSTPWSETSRARARRTLAKGAKFETTKGNSKEAIQIKGEAQAFTIGVAVVTCASVTGESSGAVEFPAHVIKGVSKFSECNQNFVKGEGTSRASAALCLDHRQLPG